MKTVYLILAFCIGFGTGYLFFSDTDSVGISIPTKPVAEIKVSAIDSKKLSADSTLHKQNRLLSGQLKIANAKLSSDKKSLTIARNKIDEIRQTIVHDSVPCKNKDLVDSLTNRIDKLNAITDTMFLIYENKVKLNEDLIAVRDSELVVCNHSYTQMKDLVKGQALREQQLTEDLNRLLKKQKKKKFQNRLIAAGMLFVSGVATTLLIRSKQ